MESRNYPLGSSGGLGGAKFEKSFLSLSWEGLPLRGWRFKAVWYFLACYPLAVGLLGRLVQGSFWLKVCRVFF